MFRPRNVSERRRRRAPFVEGACLVALFGAFVALVPAESMGASERLLVIATGVDEIIEAGEVDSLVDEAIDAASFFPEVALFSLPHTIERTRLRDRLDASTCGSDARCLAARIAEAGARRALLVIVDRRSSPQVLRAEIIDGTKGLARASASVRIEPARRGEALADAVRSSVTRVLSEAGYVLGGRVVVETFPEDADVAIDGVFPGSRRDFRPSNPRDVGARESLRWGSRQVTFTVQAGVHVVGVERDGHAASSTEVVVRSGAETRVKVVMARARSLIESPWLWAGIGALLIAGATATAVALRSNDDLFLCQARDPSLCE